MIEDELERQLRQLAKETCSYAEGSSERKQRLEQMIRQLMQSRKLWRGNVSETDYQDILQKTWIYFCGNLCEATTAGAAYNPQRGSVITWINAYIKMRVLDYQLETERQKRQQASSQLFEDGNTIDPIDTIPSPQEPPPILQEMLAWVERDSKLLRRIHLRDRPEINCKTLILRRLPPETSWRELALEFGVKEDTLQAFYRRECLPRLREAGKQLGYL